MLLTALERRLAPKLHGLRCRDILRTPPLALQPAPLKFVSQVSHRDLSMYLAAVKSLYWQIGKGSIVVLNDGSLQPGDLDVLAHHLGSPKVVDINSIDTGRCPRGGTWERLIYILGCTANDYVIQVDSDTVTRGAVSEVVACWHENQSFTLGTRAGQAIESVVAASDRVRNVTSTHLQIAAERSLEKLPGAAALRYVRGSSGFAGFARGAHSLAAAEEFSQAMEDMLGKRWSEWGSEQVASNFLIANAPNSLVLPLDRYACFDNQLELGDQAFLHFIGTFRYHNGVYGAETRKLIARHS